MKPDTSQLKSNLRKKFLEQRKELSFDYREEASEQAAQIFIHHPAFKQSEHIACYLPVKDEFDTRKIIEAIWQAQKKCYLPVLNTSYSASQQSLYFVRYQAGDPLTLNRYNIYEPLQTKSQINPADLDLVLTPLIAFDLAGTRLGTGGGYYDRTFSALDQHHKPLLYGLAFAHQEANSLPREPWDIPLDGIITEKGFIKIVTS